MNNELKLIVMNNMKEFGESLNKHLQKLNNNTDNYLVDFTLSRFQNGEGKMVINETVRCKNVFIVTDVGNYGECYMLHNREHYISPDEHFQDIKRAISAIGGHANKITIVMPLLYESRQHKRKGRESLDCAISLQELERLGADDIVTFDCHDVNVCNAIPTLPFENFYPTCTVIKSIIENESDSLNNLLVISPDVGAMERAKYYAEMLGCDVGMFYKRRDYSKVVNGKNPVVCHQYMGSEINGKNVIVVDDMISSGGSMLEVCDELRKNGANKVYLVVTYCLFTEGYEIFEEAYKNKLFNKLYTTNLSYIEPQVAKKKWIKVVDCSFDVAKVINNLSKNKSISHMLNNKDEIINMIREKNN